MSTSSSGLVVRLAAVARPSAQSHHAPGCSARGRRTATPGLVRRRRRRGDRGRDPEGQRDERADDDADGRSTVVTPRARSPTRSRPAGRSRHRRRRPRPRGPTSQVRSVVLVEPSGRGRRGRAGPAAPARRPWSVSRSPAPRPIACVVGVVGRTSRRRGRRRRGRRHPRLAVTRHRTPSPRRCPPAARGCRRPSRCRSTIRPAGRASSAQYAFGRRRPVAGVGGRLTVDAAEQARELRGTCEREPRLREGVEARSHRLGRTSHLRRRRRTRTKSTTTVIPVASVQAPARAAGRRRGRRRPTARSPNPARRARPRGRGPRAGSGSSSGRLLHRAPATAHREEGGAGGEEPRPDQRELAGGRAGRRQLRRGARHRGRRDDLDLDGCLDAGGLPDQRRRCASPARCRPG